MKKIIALSALAASAAAFAPAASAASTPSATYHHFNSAFAKHAACDADTKAFAARAKVKAPACELTPDGWRSDVSYVATKPIASGDVKQTNPWMTTLPMGTWFHGPYEFATKADAVNHMNWMVAKVKANPEIAQLQEASVTKTAKGYSYTVSYTGVSDHPLMPHEAYMAVA